jgi:NAD dependent epimerase/dehydratase family enzyme
VGIADMKILLIGGTGLVGSYLLPKLIENKFKIYALTRSNEKVPKINSLGAMGVLGDIRHPDSFIKSIDKLDLIILLAMPSIKPGKRVTKKRFKELKKETNDFFKNSMDLAVKFDVPIILPSGTSYSTKDNEIADETWAIQRIGLTKIGADTDKMVSDAIESNTPRIIQLIYGKIYGNGGLFRFMYEMLEAGKFRIIGKGENYIPNIHAEDIAEAIIKVIEKMPIGERFILADDGPVTQKDFTFCMADIMNIKRPKSIPGFIIKLILGSDMYEIIKMNWPYFG